MFVGLTHTAVQPISGLAAPERLMEQQAGQRAVFPVVVREGTCCVQKHGRSAVEPTRGKGGKSRRLSSAASLLFSADSDCPNKHVCTLRAGDVLRRVKGASKGRNQRAQKTIARRISLSVAPVKGIALMYVDHHCPPMHRRVASEKIKTIAKRSITVAHSLDQETSCTLPSRKSLRATRTAGRPPLPETHSSSCSPFGRHLDQ